MTETKMAKLKRWASNALWFVLGMTIVQGVQLEGKPPDEDEDGDE